jgi:hypothetical protein
LASLPPEVDVPLPLRLGFIELPVVGAVPGVAELAAGSPIVDPRPLGAPTFWAKASALENARADAIAVVKSFIAGFLLKTTETNRWPREGSGRWSRKAMEPEGNRGVTGGSTVCSGDKHSRSPGSDRSRKTHKMTAKEAADGYGAAGMP